VAGTDFELLAPGETLMGRYEIVRCIRAGGMGAVYEVVDRETRRRRAMKTMLPSMVSDPDLRARFRLEATVAAEIESEHIVEVFDAGVDTQTSLPFLVMELLRGENLAELVARRGRLPAAEVVLLLHQASLALDRTHPAGIVHRDLKPENLFVTTRDDGTPRVRLLDFGIAKVVASSTQPNTTRNLGTPLYMAPEQIRGDGDIGPAADLYSLGQLAFTLLTGSAYWELESRRSGGVYPMLLKIMEGARELASARALRLGVSLPHAFDSWFQTATALRDFERFGSASELVLGLADALGVEAPRGAAAPAPIARAPSAHSGPVGTPARLATSVAVDTASALSKTPPLAVSRPKRWPLLLVGGALTVTVGVILSVFRAPPEEKTETAAQPSPAVTTGEPTPRPSDAPSVFPLESVALPSSARAALPLAPAAPSGATSSSRSNTKRPPVVRRTPPRTEKTAAASPADPTDLR
jgi:eukaryotic-like serine/threonine-protein kinase